jgi:EAL and modified HD-GYP domain-containing signal transduction protein
MLNSAAVGLKNVTSIESALAYIGEESVKKWIAVLALRGIVDDKPNEIVRMSLIRARFGELLVPSLRVRHDPKQVFLASLLSLLHIALEKPKRALLDDIHVSDDIRESLLTKEGVYSDLLCFFEDYEHSNWESVSRFVDENHLDPSFVNEAYINALQWYHDLVEAG